LKKAPDKKRAQKKKKYKLTRCWLLMPIILAYSGGSLRRITVQSQSKQIVQETLSWNIPNSEKDWQRFIILATWVLLRSGGLWFEASQGT
jgi:hypothetical protein